MPQSWTLWVCGKCGDWCELAPDALCVACEEGICREVPVVPRQALDEALEALAGLHTWAVEAGGHYGVEECAGPGQPATGWDEVQDGLQAAAERAREVLSKADERSRDE